MGGKGMSDAENRSLRKSGRLRIQRLSGAVLWLLLGVTLLVSVGFFMGGETPEGQRVVADASLSEPRGTDGLMVWMYVLLGLTLLVSVTGVIVKFAARCVVAPRSALRSLMGVALVAVVLAVSWWAGSGSPLSMPGYDGGENVPFWLKVADMFLYTIYVLMGLAVALMAGFGIARRFR